MHGLLYIIILIVVTSCTYSSHSINDLNEAEALMLDEPAKALDRLNGLDVSEFEDSADMARWALLYSEAMVANKISAPRDTIVNIAIDYYESHGLDEKASKALALKEKLSVTGEYNELCAVLYAQKEKEFELYKERVRGEQYLLCGLIVLLIAAGVICRQRQRLRLAAMRNETLIAEASSLRDGLSQKQIVMTDVLARRFSTIDELCNTYYESAGTKVEQKNIASKVKSQIDAIKNDEVVFAGIERDVNECRGRIAAAIKPQLKTEEFRLFVFLACGLSNRAIALLLGENIEVIYKRKSRLKSKISGLDLPEKAAILKIF